MRARRILFSADICCCRRRRLLEICLCATEMHLFVHNLDGAFNEVTASPGTLLPSPCPFSLSLGCPAAFQPRSATVGALIDESAAGSMNTPRLTVDETKKNPTRSGLAWCYFWEFSRHDFLSTSPRFRLFMLNTSI